jgi:hypothetical protein
MAFSLALLVITVGGVTRRLDASGFIRLSLQKTRKKLNDDALGRLTHAFRLGKPFLIDLHFALDEISPHTDVIAPIFAAGGAGISESVYVVAEGC